ncbi:hypothetical protein [Nocardiopsis ganjiahuensis]|nr:hypothetical protein [Nocardiopsis ganjiahuensis]
MPTQGVTCIFRAAEQVRDVLRTRPAEAADAPERSDPDADRD